MSETEVFPYRTTNIHTQLLKIDLVFLPDSRLEQIVHMSLIITVICMKEQSL